MKPSPRFLMKHLCLSLSFNGSPPKKTNSSELREVTKCYLSRSGLWCDTWWFLQGKSTFAVFCHRQFCIKKHDMMVKQISGRFHGIYELYPLNTSKMTNEMLTSEVECFMTTEFIFAWTVWLHVFWFDTSMSVAMVVYQTFHHTQIVDTLIINQWLID